SKRALKSLWGKRYGREVETYLEMADVIDKHRDRLWEIASTMPLKEATKYERAGYEIVPEEYRDELDADDYDEEAVAAEPGELWDKVQRLYQKMWNVPAGMLALSDRVELVPNK